MATSGSRNVSMLLLGMIGSMLMSSNIHALGTFGLETTENDRTALEVAPAGAPAPASDSDSLSQARLLGLQLATLKCPASVVAVRRADKSRIHELSTLKCFTITSMDISQNTTSKLICVGAQLAVWVKGEDLAVEVL